MRHFDDITEFAKTCGKEVIKAGEISADTRFAIEEEIEAIYERRKFPDWEYRRYLRGHYKNAGEFIEKVCDFLKCNNAALLIEHAEYTLTHLETLNEIKFIKTCEENGIRNFDGLAMAVKTNIIEITLTTQNVIKKNLRSNNTKVQMEAAKVAVRMLGNQMLQPNIGIEQEGEAADVMDVAESEANDVGAMASEDDAQNIEESAQSIKCEAQEPID